MNDKKNNEKDNKAVIGMSVGLCIGAVGMLVLALFDQIAWGGLSVALGALLGMIIGININKK